MIVYRIVNTEKMRKIEINKMLLGLVLAFFSCISHADENRYWDENHSLLYLLLCTGCSISLPNK